ncbi:Zinc finger MYM-type protein 1, partial [Camponotus floridanus]
AFRGSNEQFFNSRNGNFLGTLELLAEYDDFLKVHIAQDGNKKKGHVSYLSNTICDEFIEILGEHVRKSIVHELKNAKYFSIIVDSTPDIENVDQLTIVIRYVSANSCPVERFLLFLPNVGHKGEQMGIAVLKTLEDLNIDFQNCRGQSYDNAANMSGCYNGLQAWLAKENKLAFYFPCAAHSLNLVGNCGADCCLEATRFFLFVQNIYVFFSGSPARWEIMRKHLLTSDSNLVPKRLSETRWSARADAIKALSLGYSCFRNALEELKIDCSQKQTTRIEAQCFINSLNNLEIAIICEIWNDILQKFNATNKSLQNINIDLETVVKLYNSLKDYLLNLRTMEYFLDFEKRGREKSGCEEYDSKRNRKRKRHFDKGAEAETVFDARDAMKIKVYFPILDNLINALEKR